MKNGLYSIHVTLLDGRVGKGSGVVVFRDGKIVGGVALSRWYPELQNCTLWCATEVITRANIDVAAGVLAVRA